MASIGGQLIFMGEIIGEDGIASKVRTITGQLALHGVQLMSKYRVLSFRPQLRFEW